MIPIIEAEVVEKRKWIGKEEFLDLIAIAQSCPGVFAINISVFIGYKLRKILLIWKLGVNPSRSFWRPYGGYVYGRYVKPTE